MGMFDWMKTKEELDRELTVPARPSKSLGEPVLKLLESLKNDEWICEHSTSAYYESKTIKNKDNHTVIFTLHQNRFIGRRSDEELLGYNWMTDVEKVAVYNAVNDVWNRSYSKQVNERKEVERKAFSDKLDGVVPTPDISVPIQSLIKSLGNVDEWFVNIDKEVAAGAIHGQTYWSLELVHNNHDITLKLNYWKKTSMSLDESIFYGLCSTELGFTPPERSAVNQAINILMEKRQEAEKLQKFNEGRNRFNVLVKENNESN